MENISKHKYYVYVATVDGVIRYVGKGSKDRYKHCTSGASSCPELNRDFFAGKEIVVSFIEKDLQENRAEELEQQHIRLNRESIYNKVEKQYGGKVSSLKLMKSATVLERSNAFDRPKNSKIDRELIKLSNSPTNEHDFRDIDMHLGVQGLEIVLLKLEGHKPLLVLDSIKYDPGYTCLCCSSYSPGAPKKCMDKMTSWCLISAGQGLAAQSACMEDMPGHKG